jgi:hypothetical protein
MPVYILDMLELPAEIKSAFEKGEFSIRQTSGSFNGIEKTIIKNLKGSGGTFLMKTSDVPTNHTPVLLVYLTT